MTKKRLIYSIIDYLKVLNALLRVRSLYWASKVVHIPFDTIKLDRGKDSIFLEDFGIYISRGKNAFFLELWDYACRLKELAGTRFEIIDDDLYAYIDGVKFYVETEDEIYILHEIFVEGVYNFIPPKPVVVLDIGMNVGLSSLYFATKPYVVSVIGYEPFERAYEQALLNFGLNSKIAGKIEPKNVGLGVKSETLVVDYSYEAKCIANINGLPDELKSTHNYSSVKIDLINVSDALDDVVSKHQDVEIIAKIDCEGSEYQIIESLCSSGKISYLKGIFLEWHDYSQNPRLMDNLTKSGFSLIFLNPNNQTFGMLYAARIL